MRKLTDNSDRDSSLELLRLIELLNQDSRKLAADVARLNTAQEILKNDMASLLKIVRDGNGRESLVSLVTRLDERIEQLAKVSAPSSPLPVTPKANNEAIEAEQKSKIYLALIAAFVSISTIAIPFLLSQGQANKQEPIAPSLPTNPSPLRK